MSDSKTDTYQTILKITNTIIHQRTRSGLFKEIYNVLQPLLRFDRISIILKRTGTITSWDYFSPALGVNMPMLDNNTLAPQRAEIPRRVMQEKKTFIVDISREGHLPEAAMLTSVGLRSFICTPLLMPGQPVGTLQLFYKNEFPLSAEEVDMVEKVSQQIALAIDNMLAYEKLEQLKDSLAEEKAYLQKEIEALDGPHEVVYKSPVMQQIIDTVRNVARTDTTVLITGETGTGKELIARTIHDLSLRKNKTFIKVNCAALVPTLIESELFGHERGAFTGAAARKIGRFEIANKTTLFMDEIGELPLNTQAKLLQVLQDGVFERVGGVEPIKTDVRIIAATNQNLKKLVEGKQFRGDLFYRLNIFPIHVPPLRDRAEDIPVLGSYFGGKFCIKLNRPRPHMEQEATDMLMGYGWPGNVRELQNFIERIIILKSGQTVTGEDIKNILSSAPAQDNEGLTLAEVEKKHIEKVLQKTKGRVAGASGAAELLGIKRSTLQYQMKKFGIKPSGYKD